MSNDTLLITLETERRYVAKELHDGVAQTALQLGLQASICSRLLEMGNMEMLASELTQLEERAQLASIQVRDMIADMRPPSPELEITLQAYIQQAIKDHLDQDGPPVEYHDQLSVALPAFAEPELLALLRIVQEALHNIRKHAQAQQVRLNLADDDQNFYITIADDGQGFDPIEVQSRPVDKGGAGLTNMHARAQALEGSLTADRDKTDQWTEITLTLPKSPEAPNVLLSSRLG